MASRSTQTPTRARPLKPPRRTAERILEVTLALFNRFGERRFAGWSMGQVNMKHLNPALLLKYSEKPTLDPFTVSGHVSMALFHELMATASIVGQA